jgi:quinol monooxygenase YgiN
MMNHLSDNNIKLGLLVRLESKPGKEAEIEKFLQGGLALVNEEPATSVWFAIRLGKSTFGIFDAFANEAGRQAHLAGKVAEALFAKAPELFSQLPVVEQIEIIASKI